MPPPFVPSHFNRLMIALMSPLAKPPVPIVPNPPVERRGADVKVGRVVGASLTPSKPVMDVFALHLLGGQAPVLLGDDPMGASVNFYDG
jgi:hypothetical protein